MPGTEDRAENKTSKTFCLHRAYILIWGDKSIRKIFSLSSDHMGLQKKNNKVEKCHVSSYSGNTEIYKKGSKEDLFVRMTFEAKM